VTVSHPPGGRLPLLSIRPTVTSPAAEHHCILAGTKLYCLVIEAHRCEQLAQGCYVALPRVRFEPATYWSQVQRSTRCATAILGKKQSRKTVPLGICSEQRHMRSRNMQKCDVFGKMSSIGVGESHRATVTNDDRTGLISGEPHR